MRYESVNVTEKRYPLSGTRVLDFTHVLAGPFCARLLADFGADVAKVESSLRPERLGAKVPAPDSQGRRDRTAPFLSLNRNKRSIAINLKSEAGRALAQRLSSVADIVLENFSAGVMARLGLDYARLAAENPRLVYVSMSGFGHEGPRRHATSMNMTLQAYSGLMMANGKEGDPPTSIANSWNDYIGGFHACLGAMTALAERTVTGKGAYIDLAQFECSVSTLAPLVLASAVSGAVPRKWGNQSPAAVPQGVYRCLGDDEWCAITVQNDSQWKALVEAMDNPAGAVDPHLRRFIDRVRGRTQIDQQLESWTCGLPAVQVEKRLKAAGVPAQRMRRGNDIVDERREAGVFAQLDDPPGWRTLVASTPFKFREGLPDLKPAPLQGEHAAAILQEWLGLDEREVAGLVTEGATESIPA